LIKRDSKTIPVSFDERIHRIKLLTRGWINYFKPASIQAKLKKLEEWLGNCIWHHWKKPERKRKNLIRLGIDQACAWSRTGGMGCSPKSYSTHHDYR